MAMIRRVLILFFIVFNVGVVNAACDRPLQVHIDLDPPSSYLDQNRQLQGMDVAMLTALSGEMHCAIAWHTEVMSGARVLRSIEQGQFDAIIRASKTAERQQYAHFSLSYRDEVIGVYALKTTQLIAYKTLNEAMNKGLRIIAPATGFYGDEFEQVRQMWFSSGRMTQYKNAVIATQLLLAKPLRGEIVLVDSDVFYYTLGLERAKLVFNPSQWLRITPAFIMMSKKTVSSEQVEQLNRAITVLKKTGLLQAIEAKYRPKVLLDEMKRVQ